MGLFDVASECNVHLFKQTKKKQSIKTSHSLFYQYCCYLQSYAYIYSILCVYYIVLIIRIHEHQDMNKCSLIEMFVVAHSKLKPRNKIKIYIPYKHRV